MNKLLRTGLLSLAIVLAAGACQTNPPAPSNLSSEEVQKRRQDILQMSDAALEKLYAQNPDARAEIQKAVGYAVFDVSLVNALVLVGARGQGVIVDNGSGKQTFMRTARAGTGPGIGYQEVFQVFVFKSGEALAQFKLGDTGGGDVGASATAGSSNKQLSFNPYITVYEVRDKGFAVQANWGGTVYLVDPDLN